jgi:hypothetical protein
MHGNEGVADWRNQITLTDPGEASLLKMRLIQAQEAQLRQNAN